jgi:inner membrane protein
MASAFTHGIVGLALVAAFAEDRSPRLFVVAAACAVLPDGDAVAFKLGIPYGSLFGHRGFTHSLVFALLTGLVATVVAFHELRPGSRSFHRRALFLAAVTATHGVLDALTNGGLGVAFFSPFDLTRYFCPWRPIQVSPVRVSAFFTGAAWRILASEVRWVWAPALALVLASWVVRRVRRLAA